VAGDTTTANYTFTVTDDRALVAKFKPVTSLFEPPGEVRGISYEVGELAKLKAKPGRAMPS
jgi:hypothetical protein